MTISYEIGCKLITILFARSIR